MLLEVLLKMLLEELRCVLRIFNDMEYGLNLDAYSMFCLLALLCTLAALEMMISLSSSRMPTSVRVLIRSTWLRRVRRPVPVLLLSLDTTGSYEI